MVKCLEPLLVNPGVVGRVQTVSRVSLLFVPFLHPPPRQPDRLNNASMATSSLGPPGRMAQHRSGTHPSSAGVMASALGP
jgi:hypothetical protein